MALSLCLSLSIYIYVCVCIAASLQHCWLGRSENYVPSVSSQGPPCWITAQHSTGASLPQNPVKNSMDFSAGVGLRWVKFNEWQDRESGSSSGKGGYCSAHPFEVAPPPRTIPKLTVAHSIFQTKPVLHHQQLFEESFDASTLLNFGFCFQSFGKLCYCWETQRVMIPITSWMLV